MIVRTDMVAKTKVDAAVERLTIILPLQANQERCNPELKRLHQAILRSFIDLGRILTRDEMSALVDDVDAATAALRLYDMVTFAADGDPTGAYPFTMTEREHKVHVNGHTVHAMCSLDALAIAPMFDAVTQINSECRMTGDPVIVEMSGTTVINQDAVADLHIGIAWAAADSGSSCSQSLCTEMIFLRNSQTAQAWLDTDTEGREIFSLPQAVEFATRFFLPLVA